MLGFLLFAPLFISFISFQLTPSSLPLTHSLPQMDVARLLQPGSPSSRNIVAFGSEIMRGLLNDRASPRISRAFGGGLGGGGGLGLGSEKKEG